MVNKVLPQNIIKYLHELGVDINNYVYLLTSPALLRVTSRIVTELGHETILLLFGITLHKQIYITSQTKLSNWVILTGIDVIAIGLHIHTLIACNNYNH